MLEVGSGCKTARVTQFTVKFRVLKPHEFFQRFRLVRAVDVPPPAPAGAVITNGHYPAPRAVLPPEDGAFAVPSPLAHRTHLQLPGKERQARSSLRGDQQIMEPNRTGIKGLGACEQKDQAERADAGQ